MKVKTHLRVAKIALRGLDFSAPKAAAFCLGVMIPDMVPFYHPHYFKYSGGYVFRRLGKLIHRHSLVSFFWRGVMAHYVTDFCCSAHADGLGVVVDHIAYEKALEKYTKANLDAIKAKLDGAEMVTDLHEALSIYMQGERNNYERDFCSAVQACSALLYSYTPAECSPQLALLDIRSLELSLSLDMEAMNADIDIKHKHGKHI